MPGTEPRKLQATEDDGYDTNTRKEKDPTFGTDVLPVYRTRRTERNTPITDGTCSTPKIGVPRESDRNPLRTLITTN